MLGIISWLIDIAKGIGYWFTEVFREAIKFTTTTWGVVVLIAGLAYTAMADTVGAINSALNAVQGMGSGPSLGSTSGISTFLATTNTFCPLDEAFAYGSAYLVLVCGIGLYRVIKSWIPTLSGG